MSSKPRILTETEARNELVARQRTPDPIADACRAAIDDTVQPWLDSLSRMWADPDVVRGLELTPAQPEHWWISYSPLWGILDQPEAL